MFSPMLRCTVDYCTVRINLYIKCCFVVVNFQHRFFLVRTNNFVISSANYWFKNVYNFNYDISFSFQIKLSCNFCNDAALNFTNQNSIEVIYFIFGFYVAFNFLTETIQYLQISVGI
jgi:hypothetical protein